MTYTDAVAWYGTLADYESRRALGAYEADYNLVAVGKLLDALGRPDRALSILHVAGTNGKGSTTLYLEQGLLAAGHAAGAFLSPHVERINERLRLGGVQIDDGAFAAATAAVADAARGIAPDFGPTAFEAQLAAFLAACRDSGMTHAVVETGVGGRLDATNALDSRVAVLTPVGMDHAGLLGGTLGSIAREKAGIMRTGRPAVSAPQSAVVRAVFEAEAAARGAELAWSTPAAAVTPRGLDGVDVTIDGWTFRLAMPGSHQATAFLLARAALGAVGLRPDPARWAARLAGARLPARCEFFPGDPDVLLDGAHNEPALRALSDLLARRPGPRTLVFAMLDDKDWHTCAAVAASLADRVFVTTAPSPRTADPVALAAALARAGLQIGIEPDPEQALARARAAARPGELVVVAGSFYLCGALRPAIRPSTSLRERS